MFLHQRFIPGLAIYSYMVGDEKTKECAVIDPTRDVDDFINRAKQEGLRITHILETHVHADFVSGARELKARLNDEPQISCSGMGGEEWIPAYADNVVQNGSTIQMGSIRLEAIHTPGHTPEHVAWALYDETRSADTPWLMFTGDFVFVGDVGRPDLLGEEARAALAHQLYGSVFNVLPGLPDFTEVFPGHGAGSLCGKAIGSRSSSTLGYERRYNVSLQEADEPDWVDTLLDGMPIAPPYFRRMKEINAKGPEIIGAERPGQTRFSAKEVEERRCADCLIIDVRPKEAFAAGHIPDAINIPLGPVFPTWAGWVLPYDKPTLIVLDDPRDMDEVVTHLIRVGFDDVRGYLEGGMDAWQVAGYRISRLNTLSVHELNERLATGNGSAPVVLDVRTEREWQGGHIEDAHHIHGGLLQDECDKVPKDRPVAVICGSGYRASIAASFLKRNGFDDVSNVLGGMSAYSAAGFDTVSS
jgi:hydroxyacylglutathione hydrolase